MKTNVKKVINPFQVTKMFEMDFSEKKDRQTSNTVPRRLTVSKEDGRWKLTNH